MFHPLPLFVGLRYARARTHRYFVSFITWVSLIGVCVGVAALIVILSVMNGFESELRGRLLDLSAPVRGNAVAKQHPTWEEVRQQILAVDGIKAVDDYAQLLVLAVRQPEMQVLNLRTAADAGAAKLQTRLLSGSLADMRRGEGLVLGQYVAEELGVVVGDHLTLMIPGTVSNGLPDP
ncbi:MAG TPA: ABC transporter permease, partial [Burkholderiaceae bacterium]|nr:ABC transporter permease [Burkholderiaceae bacterium]